ncbi:IS200/IS605 family transposase [Flaviaesturariibacter aridisoli]|uniref:IS200/IS605 family transposase n=1 Tax=Flaviaesturariibacter aridisoli TaxID=2545761 RepID=A0A4R4DYT2_9BACT|nr:IS200/IS605 family transposase [Flaviaesturariibacter aridisoli]TCZ68615.1 IS200/IS605 family transposase [Flaviaesturariibacter aridisoli]
MSTYTQLYYHIPFSVKYRQALLVDDWREELHRYDTGLIQGRGHKLLAINSVADHLHVLAGCKPRDPLPDLMRELKSNSSAWINARSFTARPFAWQEGYTAISVSPSAVGTVCGYIARQQEHHRTRSHREELIELLDAAGIAWKPEYLFTEPVE